MSKKILGTLVVSLMVASLGAQISRSRMTPGKVSPDVEQFRESWRVLEPITRRNLSVYPVVSSAKVDTSEFLTLDEGLASGAVRIMERGQVENALYRRRRARSWPPWEETSPELGASVNELVLLNDSSRPLVLLAGEVVSGGKQNRIVGADLVVPPKSDPLPLTVFCVEHGRWSAGGTGFNPGMTIAAPAIRKEAQANKSQEGVWESVELAARSLAVHSSTSSYQDVVNSPRAKREFDELASLIQADYEKELREHLRGRNAVGVVVAISGELVWSDIFSSQELFQKYWPKLLRSYVMEAERYSRNIKGVPSLKDAEAFLLEDNGHVSVHTEPAAYRRTEISARDYQIVAIEALGKLADAGLLIHYNKMTRD